jgi:predicted dehydrogenase
MPEPVSTALIGYGYWGPNLARNLHQNKAARLAVICDSASDRLADAPRLYPGVQTAGDAAAVFNDPAIEAVVISTPVRTHYALARAALEHGKHVLVEKPIALSSAESSELIALANRSGRTLMVGHTFEYNSAVLKIKELIDKDEIGQVYYIYSNRVNLGRVQRDVNVLWSIAPHDISILLYLLGAMPLEVSARGATYLSEGIEDVVFATLVFPNNVLAHIHASWLDPGKVRRMTVVGSRKMVVYDDVDSEAKIKIYDKGVYRKGDPIYGEFQFRLHSGDIYIPKIDMSEPLQVECSHFLECVRSGQRPRSDGESGRRVVRVLEAAQESLAHGGLPVSVERG